MRYFKSYRKNSGFTLIELLVVVAIIGILSSVVMASLNTARAKARDVRRMADLKQIQTALELYYDTSKVYPSTGGSWRGNCAGYGGFPNTGAGAWIPNLAPANISVLPTDPKPNGTHGCYLYRSDTGAEYKLLAHQTMEAGCPPMPANHGMYDPARSPSQCTIGLYTPGAVGY